MVVITKLMINMAMKIMEITHLGGLKKQCDFKFTYNEVNEWGYAKKKKRAVEPKKKNIKF